VWVLRDFSAELMMTRLELDEGDILQSLEYAISLDQDFRKVQPPTLH
jgi:hypothetical protein